MYLCGCKAENRGQLCQKVLVLLGLLGETIIGKLHGHGTGVAAKDNSISGDNRRPCHGIRIGIEQVARIQVCRIPANFFLFALVRMIRPLLHAFGIVLPLGKLLQWIVGRYQVVQLTELIMGSNLASRCFQGGRIIVFVKGHNRILYSVTKLADRELANRE